MAKKHGLVPIYLNIILFDLYTDSPRVLFVLIIFSKFKAFIYNILY